VFRQEDGLQNHENHNQEGEGEMKTVDEILRKMRKFADEQEKNDYYDLRALSTDSFRAYADLIEAAVKNQFRDTTKTMPEVAVIENATTTPTSKDSLEVGNAAALRKALINVQTLIKVLSQCHANDLPTAVKSILRDMAFRISEALATPPRNCDVMSYYTARKVWFASEIVPRLSGDLSLGQEVPFEEWFVSQHEKGKSK
jgi:hypothetical protein